MTGRLTFGKWLIVGLLLSQRLVLPLGQSAQVAAVILLAIAAALWGTFRGWLVLDQDRTALYLIAILGVAVMSVVHLSLGFDVSWLSIALLVLLYAPACVRAARLSLGEQRELLWFFVQTMTVLAACGICVFLAQFVGFAYRDLVALVIPEKMLQVGYVTSYPIFYGSPIYRANGVIFLEPSFFSLFCGLALLTMLVLGRRGIHLVVLSIAMICSLSGNGFVVLGVGVLVLLARAESRRRVLLLAAPVALVFVTALATPLGHLILQRTVEGRDSGSSTSLRMIVPYQVLLPRVTDSLPDVLFGHGAASADRLSAETIESGLITPPVPKLLFEYGMLGTIAVLVFLLVMFFADPIDLALSASLAAVYFVVNAGLLIPTLAMTAILFTSVLRTNVGARGQPGKVWLSTARSPELPPAGGVSP